MSTTFSVVNHNSARIGAFGRVPSRVQVPGYEFGVSYHCETAESIESEIGFSLTGEIEITHMRRALMRVTHRAGAELRDLLSKAQCMGATHVCIS